MFIVSQTPANYKPPGGEPFCILDPEDGDVWDFYKTEEEANAAYITDVRKYLESVGIKVGEGVKTWQDYYNLFK